MIFVSHDPQLKGVRKIIVKFTSSLGYSKQACMFVCLFRYTRVKTVGETELMDRLSEEEEETIFNK